MEESPCQEDKAADHADQGYKNAEVVGIPQKRMRSSFEKIDKCVVQSIEFCGLEFDDGTDEKKLSVTAEAVRFCMRVGAVRGV